MIRAAPTGPGHRHGTPAGVPPPEGDGRHAPLRLPPYRCAEANPHRRGFPGFPTGPPEEEEGGGWGHFPAPFPLLSHTGLRDGFQVRRLLAAKQAVSLFTPSSPTPSPT